MHRYRVVKFQESRDKKEVYVVQVERYINRSLHMEWVDIEGNQFDSKEQAL